MSLCEIRQCSQCKSRSLHSQATAVHLVSPRRCLARPVRNQLARKDIAQIAPDPECARRCRSMPAHNRGRQCRGESLGAPPPIRSLARRPKRLATFAPRPGGYPCPCTGSWGSESKVPKKGRGGVTQTNSELPVKVLHVHFDLRTVAPSVPRAKARCYHEGCGRIRSLKMRRFVPSRRARK